MRFKLPFGTIIVALASGVCLAQTTDTTGTGTASSATSDATQLSAHSPQENAKPGSVSARAPSTWVSAARARHSALITDRVGEDNRISGTNHLSEASSDGTTDSSSGSSSGDTSGGSTSGLSDLLSGLMGDTSALSGLLGSLGGSGLSSLLGGLTAKSISPVETPAAESGSKAASVSSATSLTSAGALLSQFGMSGTGTAKTYYPKNATTQVRNDGSAAETTETTQTTTGTSKADARSQTTGDTTTPDKFWKRLANSLMQTTFSALALGLSTSTAVNVFKNLLAPIFDTNQDGTNANDNGNSNTNGNGNDNSSVVMRVLPKNLAVA